jgi:peptidoglycan/xylan/chitin deacetylase (PgdA/CDA1 family)
MDQFKNYVADFISNLYGRLPKTDNQQCRVLMYHAIGTPVPGDTKKLYNLQPEIFKAHINYLGELNANGSLNVYELFHDISLRDGVVITFDDGYLDNLLVAAPALIQQQLPFTVFIAPKLMLSGDKRYLTPDTLKELSSLPGVTIGAHGYSHLPLTTLNNATLACELKDSRAWLEDTIGKPVLSMSYPHGCVDARVQDAVNQAGFKLAASSRFGAHTKSDQALLIPRTDIWAKDGIARFKAKLAGSWDWLRWIQ